MALSRVKVWSAGETLTAADLNAEIQNLIDNATSLISPLGGSLDWDGYAHTLDAAGVTTAQSTSSIGWSFTPGSKAGTPGTTGSVSNWAANTYTDNNTAASGTATSWTGHSFQRPTLAASNATVTTTDAATVYIANSPLAGSNETLTNAWSLWVDNGGVRFDSTLRVDGAATFNSTVAGTPTGGMAPAGQLFGMTLSNNGSDATNDIDIAAGECVSDDSTPANRVIMTLSSSITKQLDASWAVGTNAGGRATGVAIANGTYHVFVIYRSDTGVTDVAFDTSVTGANIATNTNAAYTKKRRIGSILRESAAIVTFVQDGDLSQRAHVLDVNAANPGTSAVTATLSVPTGLAVRAMFNAQLKINASGSSALFSDLAVADVAPVAGGSAPAVNAFQLGSYVSTSSGGGVYTVRTNSSGQIRYRLSASDASTILGVSTWGWLDNRGRVN